MHWTKPSRQEAVAAALRREWRSRSTWPGAGAADEAAEAGERDHILLRTFHHIVSDGWSEGVFNREFAVLYEAFRRGPGEPAEAAGGAVCGLCAVAAWLAGR